MYRFYRALAVVTAITVATPAFTTADAQGQGRGRGNRGVQRLSGTYELDRTQSDNPQQIANRATQTLPSAQRNRVYQNVVERLEAPERLVIDVNGRTVSMMSNNAGRMTFEADGRARSETGPDGRGVSTIADVRRGELTVSMTGARGSTYTVLFEPLNNNTLRVTRRLDNGVNSTQIVSQATYRRVDDARWNPITGAYDNTYRNSNNNGSVFPRARANVAIPEGVRLTASLDRELNGDAIRDGEQFSATVTEPAQYRGAVIDGVVGRPDVNDRADIVFDFANIRMPNGGLVPYEGVIETVRLPNGQMVQTEQGTIEATQSGSSSSTIKSGAIGAGIGAIIGAIAGGKKGAVIGAVAGGAGGVVLGNRRNTNDRTLPLGTEFTIATVRR